MNCCLVTEVNLMNIAVEIFTIIVKKLIMIKNFNYYFGFIAKVSLQLIQMLLLSKSLLFY